METVNDVVLSDDKYLANELNNLKKDFKTLTATTFNYNTKVDSSTTNIPQQEPAIITKLLASSNNLISKFETDITNMIEIGTEYKKLDESLKNVANIFDMTVTSSKISSVALKDFNSETPKYNLSSSEVLDKINVSPVDLTKYAENIEGGFYLWISSKKYTLDDFENSVWRKRYGYSVDQAIEAFIGCCIAESDKTIDDVLAVATTILNRCESSNWGSHYENGTNPFDQLYANNGAQFAVIQGRNKKYMPCVVGMASVEEELAKYGADYETLKATVLEALEHGVRNHDYTGFRSNGWRGYYDNLRHISPKGNRYQFENPGVDAAIAEQRRNNRKMVDLSGTGYNANKKIPVENGADLNGLTYTLSDTSSNGNDNTNPINSNNPRTTSSYGGNVRTSTGGNNTQVNEGSPIGANTAASETTSSPKNQTIYVTSNQSSNTSDTSTIPSEMDTTEPDDKIDDDLYQTYDTYDDIMLNTPTEIVDTITDEEIEPNVETDTSKGNPILTGLGIAATLGAAAGAAAYGIKRYKENNNDDEFEEEESLEEENNG